MKTATLAILYICTRIINTGINKITWLYRFITQSRKLKRDEKPRDEISYYDDVEYHVLSSTFALTQQTPMPPSTQQFSH